MKKITALTFFIIISSSLFAQNLNIAERAFINVIKAGPSTAPEFVVIKIKNLNTGVSKKICTTVSSLFWAMEKEKNTTDYKKLTAYLLNNSIDQTFDLKNSEALKRLNFDLYILRKETKIEALIKNKHLTDSLNKLVRFYEILNKNFYNYYDRRQNILKEISDSITKVRPLTSEEGKMISDLKDRYYDDYYSKPIYNQYRTISANGQLLMKIWSRKIEKDQKTFSKSEMESKRMYDKFFQQYYKKFGLSFCHVAFKYGIITYLGDENPIVGFSRVI